MGLCVLQEAEGEDGGLVMGDEPCTDRLAGSTARLCKTDSQNQASPRYLTPQLRHRTEKGSAVVTMSCYCTIEEL